MATFLLAVLFGLALVAGGPAEAGLLDDAKQQGWVGEQPDGYAGLVKPGAPANVQALVDQVNAGRRAEYERIAKEQGTSPQAVGAVFGQKLIDRAPPGSYVLVGGRWVRK